MDLKRIFGTSGLYSAVTRVLFVPLVALCLILGGVASSHRNMTDKYGDRTYTLREYNGQIAVFTDDNVTPVEVLDVYVTTLPKSDVSRLRDGITVEGRDAIRALIEDFSG